ncbi:hypothetical protein PMAYCL1PPCAC_14152, partial [Pristionchus mayeri]
GEPLSKKIEEGNCSMREVKQWTRELIQALQHLHSNGVILRNLQPGKICIDSNNKLTIIGFGKARVIDRSSQITKESGTEGCMAFEQAVDWVGDGSTQTYDERADIWSVAAILCELISGKPLFCGPDVKNSLKRQIELCGAIEDTVLIK